MPSWISIGPAVVRHGQAVNAPAVSGRITGIAPAIGGTPVYVAAANGGVWRSDDHGDSWTSLMDAYHPDRPTTFQADTLACGAIAINPANADRVYLGTGEGFGVGDFYFGVGPLRCDDGTTTASWQTETADVSHDSSAALTGKAFCRIAVNPVAPDQVVAATTNGLYLRSGTTWTRISAGAFTGVAAPSDGTNTTFFAAKMGGLVYQWTAAATGGEDFTHWTAVSSGFPPADIGSIALAVQPNNRNLVYALVSRQSNNHMHGVYRLDVSGATGTWTQVVDNTRSGSTPAETATLFGPDLNTAGQGNYDIAIAVDPSNANLIYLGGSTRHRSDTWPASLYRCVVTSSGSGSTLAYAMTPTYIGDTVHADIHALEFEPGNSNRLWVGCDGGVFFTDNATGGSGTTTFVAKNTGLSTLQVEKLACHPTEEVPLYCGVQDNGTLRYSGDDVWDCAKVSDGGAVVVHLQHPEKVIRSYNNDEVDRSVDGGRTWLPVNVPLTRAPGTGGNPGPLTEPVNFYPPIVTIPRATSQPSDADLLAFGSNRVWLSTNFGGRWAVIPSASSAAATLPAKIASLRFASASMLYAGTNTGGVYRYTASGSTWGNPTQLTGGSLPTGRAITDITVDPSDLSGNSIFVTLAGQDSTANGYQRVWHYDGTSWTPASGPAPTAGEPPAAANARLMNVQHNAIVADPTTTGAGAVTLYTGADVGIWRSADSGANWALFADGLPDAAVLDLLLHPTRRLLWAGTHGRGVYECDLHTSSPQPVQLYVRRSVLDRGGAPLTLGTPDTTSQNSLTVAAGQSPDIRVDVPDGSTFRTPTTAIDYFQFADALDEGDERRARALLPFSSGPLINRVFVQVHNRGTGAASGVRVAALLGPGETPEDLPAGYQATLWGQSVAAGSTLGTTQWKVLGYHTINGLRAGAPQVAEFDLDTGPLSHSTNYVLLTVAQSMDDPIVSSEVHVPALCASEPKVAYKILSPQSSIWTTVFIVGGVILLIGVGVGLAVYYGTQHH
jgi:hypothetical protein